MIKACRPTKLKAYDIKENQHIIKMRTNYHFDNMLVFSMVNLKT